MVALTHRASKTPSVCRRRRRVAAAVSIGVKKKEWKQVRWSRMGQGEAAGSSRVFSHLNVVLHNVSAKHKLKCFTTTYVAGSSKGPPGSGLSAATAARLQRRGYSGASTAGRVNTGDLT
jgi:hypothetical protein